MMRSSTLWIALSAVCFQVACDDDPTPPPPTAGVSTGGVTTGGVTTGGVATGGVATGGMAGVEGGVSNGGEVPQAGLPLTELVDSAAVATCDALYRCCNPQNVIDFFTPIANNPRYEDIASQIPPNAEVDADSCPALMNTIFDVAPLGSWVRSVERNLVSYDGEAAERCLEELNSATCGEGVLNALYDGTCLS